MNYYFSNEGNDSNAGTIDAPFKSITKFTSLALKPGDGAYFKGGETFFGTLKPNGSGIATSPVIIGSYGEGLATITGFKDVFFSELGNNLYESSEAVTSLSYINLVVKDGEPIHKGTYPKRNAANGGYLTIDSHVGKTSITDASLSDITIPTGSEIVVRCKKWVIDRCPISKRSGNTIYYSGVTYEPDNKWGYFLQNALSFCTENSEWYFNPSTKKLVMYSDSGAPENVRVASITNLLHTNGKSYLKISNLNFEGSAGDSIMVGSSTGIEITGCSIRFSGDHAILTNSNGSDLNINNVVIEFSLNIAIETNINNIKIQNFSIYDTYPLIGHGANGDGSRGTAIAIRHLDNDALVTNGAIRRTGNCAISFKNDPDAATCNNVEISYVDIDYSNLLKDDQGAIYTHVGSLNHPRYYNRVIKYCKVTNTVGNYFGTDKLFKAGFGIYGDIGSTDLMLIDNEISEAGRAGILMNYGAQRWTIKDNKIYNNGGGMGTDARGCQIYIQENDTRRVQNNVIENNEISAIDNRKLIYVDNSFGYAKADPGVINNNKYSCPAKYATSVFITRTKSGTIKRTFTSWRGLGYDLNSDIILK